MLRSEWLAILKNSPDGKARLVNSGGVAGTVRFLDAEGSFVVEWDDLDVTWLCDIPFSWLPEGNSTCPDRKTISNLSSRLREIELALEEMTARRLFIPVSVIAEHNSLVHILRDESRNK